jgi:shikimate kinase
MNTLFPISDRNLILTGYTGPDLTLLGQRVAEQLRKPCVNLDTLIAERLNLQVEDIRSYYGEMRLQSIEAEIVSETILRRDSVIRVSGRILKQDDHRQRLGSTGPVICVVASLDLVLHRLHVGMGARYHDPRERGAALSDLEREWAVRGKPGIHELDISEMDTQTAITAIITIWQTLVTQRT